MQDSKKHLKISSEEESGLAANQDGMSNTQSIESQVFHIDTSDRVEQKVDFIVRDVENRCQRSLTLCGAGFGVERTIAVVEELKRSYLKNGKRYSQETSIKSGENNQPHLQVVLTLLDSN